MPLMQRRGVAWCCACGLSSARLRIWWRTQL